MGRVFEIVSDFKCFFCVSLDVPCFAAVVILLGMVAVAVGDGVGGSVILFVVSGKQVYEKGGRAWLKVRLLAACWRLPLAGLCCGLLHCLLRWWSCSFVRRVFHDSVVHPHARDVLPSGGIHSQATSLVFLCIYIWVNSCCARIYLYTAFSV